MPTPRKTTIEMMKTCLEFNLFRFEELFLLMFRFKTLYLSKPSRYWGELLVGEGLAVGVLVGVFSTGAGVEVGVLVAPPGVGVMEGASPVTSKVAVGVDVIVGVGVTEGVPSKHCS